METDKTTLACDLRPEEWVDDEVAEDCEEVRTDGGEDGWWEDDVDPPWTGDRLPSESLPLHEGGVGGSGNPLATK